MDMDSVVSAAKDSGNVDAMMDGTVLSVPYNWKLIVATTKIMTKVNLPFCSLFDFLCVKNINFFACERHYLLFAAIKQLQRVFYSFFLCRRFN